MSTLFILYVLLVFALTTAEYKGDRRAQYLLKPACALGFILIALQSGALETTYGQCILGALTLCAIGDTALLSRGSQKLFLIGMGAFGLGHAIFAVTFFAPDGSMWGKLMGLAFAALLMALFIKFIWKHVLKDMRIAVAIYIGIIGLMLLTAMDYAVSRQAWGVGIAAALFALSDYFVGRDRFIAQKSWHALAITPLYFGAQALFALSVAQAL